MAPNYESDEVDEEDDDEEEVEVDEEVAAAPKKRSKKAWKVCVERPHLFLTFASSNNQYDLRSIGSQQTETCNECFLFVLSR